MHAASAIDNSVVVYFAYDFSFLLKLKPMGDLSHSDYVFLPPPVESSIRTICKERNQDPPNPKVRKMLAALGEKEAFEVVSRIQKSPGIVRNLSSLIHHRITNASPQLQQQANPSCSDSGNSGYSGGTRPSGAYSPPPSSLCNAYSSSFSVVAKPSSASPLPSSVPSAAYPSPRAGTSVSYYSPPYFGVAAPSNTCSTTFSAAAAASVSPIDHTSPFPDVSADGEGSSSGARHVGSFLSSSSGHVGYSPVHRRLPFDEDDFRGRKNSGTTNNLLVILDQLEFRKLFLLLCYIGRHKLEEILNLDDAHNIARMKDIPMSEFESCLWTKYGSCILKGDERRQSAHWDSGRTHFYYCDVFQDGSFSVKGPCLAPTRTHLQRSLGDDNVLIVKFIGEEIGYANIAYRDGIFVGLKRYHFFVYKDENNVVKKKDRNENAREPASINIKCYFVNLDSISLSCMQEVRPFPLRNVAEARCHFMHIHMVSSMAKYMARFSLILSKTIKFPVDLSSVGIEIIEDIPCRDENDFIVHGEDGKQLIQTDGTGFISEDLARLCPQDFGSAKYLNDKEFQKYRDVMGFTDLPSGGSGSRALNWEPPLLMQCRLFSKGLAVKGTLLLNRKLRQTIVVRPSMVKVERDEHPMMPPVQTFDSLEIVSVSNKPRRNFLSKNLIALLSYGGVPRNIFLDLLTSALNDTLLVFSDMRAAMKVSILHGEMDEDYTAAKMICAGVPLNEPHLQDRLSKLAIIERSNLKNGKVPIGESFYLMGTTDPTGVLNSNEVCVILENGPISGKVLVYRNPGLHFGDIHVMEAVYVKDLEDIIGNSKYGIFFSTKGRRSAAAEMGNGDFDGDMYWVSRNPQLLGHFRAGEPWKRIYFTPLSVSKKPSEYSSEEGLDAELFRQFLKTRKPSLSIAVAADSWMSFMDQLLVEEDYGTKENLRKKILKLIDIYYDAIDAPKSGKKINVPPDIIAKEFPHYMGKGHSYNSTSILGDMYNTIQQFESNESNEGIWKLPFFDQCLQTRSLEPLLNLWRKRYEEYRKDMTAALQAESKELRTKNADEVVRKYKRILYEAEEFKDSRKERTQICNEALAIYHVTYDFALRRKDRSKCGFAWKVAAPALCELHGSNRNETIIPISPSILKVFL